MFKDQQKRRGNIDLTPVNVTNIESSKGVRGSRYDALLKHFKQGGDTIEYDPDVVPPQTGSNIAKRLALVSGKKFHSFKHGINKTTCIRLRPDGENEQEDNDQEEE